MLVYDLDASKDTDSYSNNIYDLKILYRLQGTTSKSLVQLCQIALNEEHYQRFIDVCKCIKAQLNSYRTCNISIQNFSKEELIPPKLLTDYEIERESILETLFEYVNKDVLNYYNSFMFPKIQSLRQVAKALNLKFNYVGGRNGRLSFKPGTFNPYGVPRIERDKIKAREGFQIVQFDLKSAQPRLAIFTTNDEDFKRQFQDVDDIYSIFPGERQDVKIGILRWMFSEGYIGDDMFGPIAHPIKRARQRLYNKVSYDGMVKNLFGRPLFFCVETDNVIYQNFIASTEADIMFDLTDAIFQKLANTQSRILFPFYDALICEIHDSEQHLKKEISNLIENFYVSKPLNCRLPVEVKSGKDWRLAS